MSTTDVLYMIIIAIFALGIAGFQYFYKAKTNSNKRFVFAFLRFMSLFLLGLLLLNPTFKQTTMSLVKPSLIVAIDNSKSVSNQKQAKNTNLYLKAIQDSKLSEKFEVDYYSFGENINQLKDSLTFTEPVTNISKIFSTLKDVYKNTQAPTLLVTDGNQTYGQDYVLQSMTYNQQIYPVIIGDSILKTDLKITNVQHNKYSLLNNEFPVEITLSYIGKNTENKMFSVFKNSTKIYSEALSFSKENNTHNIQFTLSATHTGKQNYIAKIETISGEENKINNTRSFSIDVIDERTNVLFISDILHPDLGAYKKAIETNEQRKVSFAKSTDGIDFNKYQLVLLYQPTAQFKSVFKQIHQLDKNHLIITGLHTDWSFLNAIQTNYKKSVIDESQDYLGRSNPYFELFQTDELQLNSYPPLLDLYGTLEYSAKGNTLIYQNIDAIETDAPLLSFFESGTRREALLNGEGIWKWRAQSYLNTQSFEKFDEFIGKIIQYLASNLKKERLTVAVADEFLLGEANINTQYYDKNYVLDATATLTCKLIDQSTNKTYSYDFLFKNNSYKLNFSQLPAGKYRYEVAVKDKSLSKKGEFEIIDFDIEAQFVNPDVTKLSQLATNNKVYYMSEKDNLFSELMNDDTYKTVQKEITTNLPLINWKYLLVVLLLLLTFEWLLRKYNGLL